MLSYEKTTKPSTADLLKCKLMFTERLKAILDSMVLRGPGGWVEGYPIRGLKVRIYGPDEFTLGDDIYIHIASHTSPDARVEDRIGIIPCKTARHHPPAYALVELSEEELLGGIGHWKGIQACPQWVDMVGNLGITDRVAALFQITRSIDSDNPETRARLRPLDGVERGPRTQGRED